MDESSNTQNRRSRRAQVLMEASVESDGTTVTVKLRNLSTQGALIEGDRLPEVGSQIMFLKKELRQSGHVAWATGGRAGIAFDSPLDPEAVLRHVPSPRTRVRLDFRRPRLKGCDLTPGERKIAEDWIWGKPIPRVGD